MTKAKKESVEVERKAREKAKEAYKASMNFIMEKAQAVVDCQMLEEFYDDHR